MRFGDKKTWYYRLKNFFNFLKGLQIPRHSAAACFFLILSVFPILVLVFSLLSYTSIEVTDVISLMQPLVPDALLPYAESFLSSAYENVSGTLLSISALVALWSASRGMRSLQQGLSTVYGSEETRGYFLSRLISTLYTFVFLILLVLTLVLHVFSGALVDFLQMTTDPVLMTLLQIIDLRFVILLALQTVLFTIMYTLLPSKHNRFSDSFPGAVMAALGWLIFSDLFSKYMEYFPWYTNLFGSVYALALGMLWLYFCICIFFCGGALNRWLKEHSK